MQFASVNECASVNAVCISVNAVCMCLYSVHVSIQFASVSAHVRVEDCWSGCAEVAAIR